MRGFKDFFHETNDIALAIVIVLLAAGLIGWRIRIILQYPAQLAKEATVSSDAETEQMQDSGSSKDSEAK